MLDSSVSLDYSKPLVLLNHYPIEASVSYSMRHNARNPVFAVSDQVRHKSCTVTEGG